MKKYLLTLYTVSILLIFSSFVRQDMRPFTVKASFIGLADGTVIELVPGGTHVSEKPVASSALDKGSVTFTYTVGEPRCFYLRVKDTYGALLFLVDQGNDVTVVSNVSKDDSREESIYKFTEKVIEGSKVNEEYKLKTAPREELNRMFDDMRRRYSVLSDRLLKARMNKDKVAMDSLEATTEYKQMSKEEHDFFVKVEELTTKIFMDNKNTWWGPFLMLDQMSYFTKEQRPLFEVMSEQARTSYYGKVVYEELYPVNKAGSKIPEFTLTDRNGTTSKSASVISGNKYVLIDFWASWCSPCRKEIPNLKALYAKYHDKGLQIISISTDKKAADWEKALIAEKLPWINYRDVDESIAAIFKVNSIPAIFLVDGKGVLVDDGLRGESLSAKLEELFNN